VLEAMHTNVGHRRSVSELASVAGVSSRTLQRQFMSFLGKSPQAMQHEIGLEQARHALLQGAPGERVRNVALRCGFPHFGRFSADYRRRYGEAPSSTLKRQVRFLAELAGRPVMSAPSRDRPTVALGPIETNAEHGEIAASLADDLATALGRAGFSVTSQAQFARYRMLAAIRGIGAHKRLVIHLIDQESGRQLWAHRTDGVAIDGSESHEQLATRIVAGLQPCLRSAEIERARERPDAELGPHDLALRAMPGVLSLDAEGNAQALDLLERALHRNPDSALAAALAAWAYVQRVIYHFTTDLPRERARAIELAHKARSLSGADLARRTRQRRAGRRQGACDRRRLRLGLEPERMAGRLSRRSGIRDRALQDRARPRAAGFARLQQHGRGRLRAFQGGQLCRGRPLAGTRAGRAPLGDLGAPDAVSGLCADGRETRGAAQP
jgi:AraC-like DNA-binding protein